MDTFQQRMDAILRPTRVVSPQLTDSWVALLVVAILLISNIRRLPEVYQYSVAVLSVVGVAISSGVLSLVGEERRIRIELQKAYARYLDNKECSHHFVEGKDVYQVGEMWRKDRVWFHNRIEELKSKKIGNRKFGRAGSGRKGNKTNESTDTYVCVVCSGLWRESDTTFIGFLLPPHEQRHKSHLKEVIADVVTLRKQYMEKRKMLDKLNMLQPIQDLDAV